MSPTSYIPLNLHVARAIQAREQGLAFSRYQENLGILNNVLTKAELM
jgi:hypothetical protein